MLNKKLWSIICGHGRRDAKRKSCDTLRTFAILEQYLVAYAIVSREGITDIRFSYPTITPSRKCAIGPAIDSFNNP